MVEGPVERRHMVSAGTSGATRASLGSWTPMLTSVFFTVASHVIANGLAELVKLGPDIR